MDEKLTGQGEVSRLLKCPGVNVSRRSSNVVLIPITAL